jgi:hypothetical protein
MEATEQWQECDKLNGLTRVLNRFEIRSNVLKELILIFVDLLDGLLQTTLSTLQNPHYFVVSTPEFRSFDGFLIPSLLSRERNVLGCKPKIAAAPSTPSTRQFIRRRTSSM